MTVYFNKEVPKELFQAVNANLKNANAFMLEVLSVVFESQEIYKMVKKHMSTIPSGRIYSFPDIFPAIEKQNVSDVSRTIKTDESNRTEDTLDEVETSIKGNNDNDGSSNIEDIPNPMESNHKPASNKETKDLHRQKDEEKKKSITWKK